jgi:signal transduction histidine kinase
MSMGRSYSPAVVPRARVFTGLALLAVAAVNAAGLWSIAAGRRGVAEETARLFRVDTQARARVVESALAASRAELAFLAGSAPITQLLEGGSSEDEAFRRQSAEAALLLFLRARPEVIRLTVRSAAQEPLVMAGRRGGIPILWVSSARPTGEEGPAFAPDRPRVVTTLLALEAELSPGVLLAAAARGTPVESGGDRRCRLEDARGAVLARASGAPREGRVVSASGEIAGEGWGRPSPWRLACELDQDAAAALVQPVEDRYRTTLALNVGAMALAVVLGLLAIREVSQRERVEARAREEAHVHDLERQLFHAERLTSLGRLAAGLAHEINNPLEGMANYLRLTRDALERGDVEAARRRLDGVRQGLDRCALVVRQSLAHADPARAPKGPLDLNTVLAETTEFVRSRPEFATVRFDVHLSEAPLPVEGSAGMLGQVALNLMVNACEAQPAGGEVAVTSRREAGRAVAEVADRGPGIAEAERARIFEPFFSTKNSTGLGLSICHSIVSQHGGVLEVVPREGGGSVFRISLPLLVSRTEVA